MKNFMNVVAMELRLGRKHQNLWREAEHQVEREGIRPANDAYQKLVARCYAKLRAQQLDQSSHSYILNQIRKGLNQRDQAFTMQLALMGVGLLCSLLVFYRMTGGI